MRKLTAVLGATALIWAVGSCAARAQSAGQVGVFTDSTHMNGAAVTGSGSAVLQTSPTINSPVLTAPALGTPASGVATNLTGTAAGLTAGGNMTGPGSSTTNDCAQFADTTGKVLKDAACPGGGNVSTTGSPSSGQTAQMTGSATITGVANTGTGSYVLATSPTITSPVLVAPALGTPASGVGTNLTGTAAGLTAGVATVANGLGTTTSPVVVNGATAPTTGQVLTATGAAAANWQTPSGGGSVSVTAGTPDVVITPSPGTATFTVGTTVPTNVQSGSSYAILTGDNTKLVEMSNASPTTMTIAQAGTTGFLSGWGTSVLGTLAGVTSITPTTSTIGGLAALSLDPNQFVSIASDGTNYQAALGVPTSGTQNKVFATPNGSTGQPKLRAMVTADLPAGTTSTVSHGTSAMGTGAISSGACATVVTTTATGAATTDVVNFGFNGDPTGVTGYVPSSSGMLTIVGYPSSGNVNFKVCNNTGGSITPGAITLNWQIVR